MTILHAVILSVVEGVTEFLPVSSTGHLVLTSELLRIPHDTFTSSFLIAIQLGAMGAVVGTSWKFMRANPRLLIPLGAAFLPTAIVGMGVYKIIKNVFLENPIIPAFMLIVGGVIFIFLEKFILKRQHHKTLSTLSLSQAALIGVFQATSVVPGVSRAAATIIGGMAMGLSREEAVTFSFLLAIPTIAAATGYDLLKTNFAFSTQEIQLLGIGMIVSACTAFIAVRWFISAIKTTSFLPFGIYRIGVGLLYLFLFTSL